MDRSRGALLDIRGAEISRRAEAPQLGEPVQQPAFAVDLVSAYLLISLAQLLLEVAVGGSAAAPARSKTGS